MTTLHRRTGLDGHVVSMQSAPAPPHSSSKWTSVAVCECGWVSRKPCEMHREQDNAVRLHWKAVEIWLGMTPSEKHGVRFGLFPHEKMEAAEKEGFNDRDLSIALMDCAAKEGGCF